MKKKFDVESHVRTLVRGIAYDSEIFIPKGSQGIVRAVNVPVVRSVGKGVTFNCVDFVVNGKVERGSYYNNEIEFVLLK
jgi:hypothetical protein